MDIDRLERELFSMQDLKYREFHAGLMPTIDKDTIIGVRVPMLRKFAGEYFNDDDAEAFFGMLPHRYYEENNLHMMLISKIKDYDRCVDKLEKFLPYVDNWATCDLPIPKCFTKNKDRLIERVRKWIASDKTYTIRYGIDVLMSLYLDCDFKPEYMSLVASVISDEYYVNMASAWYFATALAKQWDEAVKYLEGGRLSLDVHNKTIRKAVESYRLSDERKKYIRSLA